MNQKKKAQEWINQQVKNNNKDAKTLTWRDYKQLYKYAKRLKKNQKQLKMMQKKKKKEMTKWRQKKIKIKN